ncbi:MAG: adenylosuccinate synthetase [Nitrososphaerota archaeon]|nr:adenylosuccinate synthetase [Nitrososphaerota archaeon]
MTSNGPYDGNLSVIGLQWGDEGKGKITDYFASDFDAVVRFNGGSNAGHTVVVGGSRHTFHLVPSGALKGKKLLIGPGVALDPAILSEELSVLRTEGMRTDIMVDGRCTLVSPSEKAFDALLEELRGGQALGTTLRGIGPAYAMRALRLAPRAMDLFSPGFDGRHAEAFYSRFAQARQDAPAWAGSARESLEGLVGDVSSSVDSIAEAGGRALFEGSQGTLLDVLHGSYPYVTGSSTLAGFIPASLGLPAGAAGEVLGVCKCYTTRVGAGPFPSEAEDGVAERLRLVGREYGATTGRPRRIGWLDLVALKYAVRVNGAREIVLSKLDVLSELREFSVCVGYRLDGSEVKDFYRALGDMGRVEPVLEGGWGIHGADFRAGVTGGLRRFVEFVEEELGVRVRMLSYGEERSRTVER